MLSPLSINDRVPLELGHTRLNHFVLLDCRGIKIPVMESLLELARTFCTTALVDDLLVIQDSKEADVRLLVLGGDGREADFCANGMIYAAAKINEEKKTGQVTIESARGIKSAVEIDGEWLVEVGPAVSLDQELVNISSTPQQNRSILGLVHVGEPHLIIDNPDKLCNGFHVHREDFENYCRPLRDITRIDGGINVTMVFENKDGRVLIRTYERGARRQTFSCGTGSASAAAVLFRSPSEGSLFDICSPGGRHKVIYEQNRWFVMAAPQRISTGYLVDSTIYLPLAGLLPYKPLSG